MKKSLLFGLLLLTQILSAQSMVGLWKTINRNTGRQESVVAVYEYKDRYYGRILGTFDRAGVMNETIDDPSKKAQGVVGHPYICGLDIIWGVRKLQHGYKGTILDPDKGETHFVDFFIKNGKLVIEKTVLFFSGSATWVPATKEDFPKGFKIPDSSDFVPKIPKVY